MKRLILAVGISILMLAGCGSEKTETSIETEVSTSMGTVSEINSSVA